MIREELIRGINLMVEGKIEEGLHMFFMQTYEFVYQRARYVMQVDVDTLELTKQTFMQVSREIETLEDINTVHSWLCNILYRQGMKMLASPEIERMHEILNEEGAFQTVFSEDKYQISVEEAQALYQQIIQVIGKSKVIELSTKRGLSLATKQILGGIAMAVIGVAVFVGVTYGKNANHQDVPNKSSEIKVGNTEGENKKEENIQEAEQIEQQEEVKITQEETTEVVERNDAWEAEVAEISGISEDQLLAAYQEGMKETGCRQTAGMHIEYIEVIGDKIIIKIDEKSGYISASSSDYTNIDVQTKEPRKMFVYDVAENCLFGEYAVTPGGDTVSYSLTNEFDFATIQGYVNEDRKVLEEYGDVGMTTGISFKVVDGLLKELCTMVS